LKELTRSKCRHVKRSPAFDDRTHIANNLTKRFAGFKQLERDLVKLLSLLLSFLFAFQVTFCPYAFAAMEGDSTTDGGSKTKVNKVGALLLADGLCVIAGSTIDITNNGQPQLHGHTFKVEQLPGGGTKGYAWFNQGPALSNLGDCNERVDLLDGSSAPGPIQDITSDTVTAAGKTFPMSSVKLVHSGHVFSFQNGEKVSKTNFNPTCAKVAAGTKAKAPKEGHLTRNIIIATVVGCLIATAIAVPIAVVTHNHGHHSSPPQTVTQPPPPPPPTIQSFFVPPRRRPPPPPPPPTNTINRLF
jgi:hypothetical protein